MRSLYRPLLGALLVVWSVAAGAQVEEARALESVRLALAHGDARRAVELARDAVAAYPESALAYLWLGNAYREAGDLPAAATAYGKAEDIDPADPRILLARGSLQEAIGDLEAAATSYDMAVTLAPGAAATWRAAGNLQMRLGDHARAIHYLGGALQRTPDDLEARYLLGLAHYFGGDPETAAREFETALELAPQHVPTSYALGVILGDRPEAHERALELLQRARDAGFERTEATYMVGRILADRGEHEAAIAALRETLAADPDHADATYRLAQALARSGRRDEAATTMERFRLLQQRFNETEARDKEIKTLRNALTDAIRGGDPGAVDVALQALLDAAPDDPETLVSAAKVWISAGRIQDALDAATAAAQLNPGHWEALYLRGLGLAVSGRQQEAVDALQASLRANPLFPDTYAVLGNTLIARGDDERAIQAYLAAIDLDADNPVYWLNLATAYEKSGRAEQAQQALARLQRLRNARDGISR